MDIWAVSTLCYWVSAAENMCGRPELSPGFNSSGGISRSGTAGSRHESAFVFPAAECGFHFPTPSLHLFISVVITIAWEVGSGTFLSFRVAFP